MSDATEPMGGPQVRYRGQRVDGSDYETSVVCDQRVEGSALFDLWMVEFDGEPAVLKEPASGRYRQEAAQRLRREASLMRRLAARPGQTRRLSPFLGAGDQRTPPDPPDSSAAHPHHFTIESTVLVNLIATGAGDHVPLSRGVRADLVVDAFAALAELHAADVIHRDLKPGNLVVQVDGGGGYQIEFIDFGHGLDLTLPPAADEPATGEDAVAGTEGWMCPHCYGERTRDPLCDVFAMALVGSAILLEQTRPLLPALRSNQPSTAAFPPVGLPTTEEQESLRATLVAVRDGLVARGPSTTAREMLAVLVDALTPEPTLLGGKPARPTAAEIHERLVAVRSPRPTVRSEPDASVADEHVAPPALVPVPDLVEEVDGPDAPAVGPYDQEDERAEAAEDHAAATPGDDPVDDQDAEDVPPLMGAVEDEGDEEEAVPAVMGTVEEEFVEDEAADDGRLDDESPPAAGEPAPAVADPDSDSASADAGSASADGVLVPRVRPLPTPAEIELRAASLHGLASSRSQVGFRPISLVTSATLLSEAKKKQAPLLPFLVVVGVLMAVIMVLVTYVVLK